MRIVCVLLMVCMSLINKEIDMPNAMKDDVAVKAPVRDVPAWSGRIGGGSNNKGSSFTDAVVSSVSAANTNGGGQWLSMDNNPAPQPAYVRPTAPTPPAWMKPVAASIAAANTNGGGQWLSMDGKPAPQPAYMNSVSRMPTRPPAYGGSYNPTASNPAFPGNQAANQQDASQQDTYNSYRGQPVDTSMSDLLRSMQPVQLGSDQVSMSDYLRSLEAGSPYVMPPAWIDPNAGASNYSGFGSKYGGNWKRGGGGGYGGCGGYGGGYDSPAWINNEMGLFSWKV